MGLFSKKSALPAPLARAPGVPEWLHGVGGGGVPRTSAGMVAEVFTSNPIGQRSVRSVRLIAGAVGTLPIYSVNRNLAAAKLLMADGLMEGIAAGLLLNGNAYVQLIVDDDDVPAELTLLPPERVVLDFDARGQAVAVDYRGGGQVTRLPLFDALGRRRVAHLKALNPNDDHYGLGCLDAAVGAAAVHNRASAWNRTLLENAARPSGALTYEPGDGSLLSGEQFERLRSELETCFPVLTGRGGRCCSTAG